MAFSSSWILIASAAASVVGCAARPDRATSGAPAAGEQTLALTVLVGERAKARPSDRPAPYLRVRSRRLDGALTRAARGAPDAAAARTIARQAASAALQAARESYRKLQFAAVISRCQAAESALVAAAASRRESELLGKLLLLRGQAHLASRQADAAAQALGFAIDLGVVPAANSGRFPPETETLLDKLRRRGDGTISVSSSPTDAEVIVDGKPRGSTPLSMRLAIGVHHVRVQRIGARPKATLHTVTSGRVSQLAVTLTAASDAERARQLRVALATAKGAARRALLDDAARLLGADGWIAPLGQRDEAAVVRGDEPAHAALSCAPDDQRCLARALYTLARGRSPERRREPVARATPLYKRWWFWTIVGAAVVGGTATGVYLGTRTPSGVDVVGTAR